MNSSPDLNIIVVNFNTSAYILNCLASLKEVLAGETHVVIVIDNHSADDSCQLIREKYPDVDLIQNSENLGFGRAVNQGFRMARGKYLLIINPDVTLMPILTWDFSYRNWLTRMVPSNFLAVPSTTFLRSFFGGHL
jgi:GT2 family glycosyltransferase